MPPIDPVGGGKECHVATVKEAATEFLTNRRIAVTGVSRNPESEASNGIYKRLREKGYEVFAVNPNATEVEGDPCYPTLADIPDGVEAVVIATKPEAAEGTVRECAELGIRHVWMHRSFGKGSVCHDATLYGRENGITVIDGGCPLMFDPVADLGHKLLRFWFNRTGKVPSTV
jgi:predicted CoA-binding protein